MFKKMLFFLLKRRNVDEIKHIKNLKNSYSGIWKHFNGTKVKNSSYYGVKLTFSSF